MRQVDTIGQRGICAAVGAGPAVMENVLATEEYSVPTIMTHSLVGLAAASVVGRRTMPKRFWLFSLILPSLPDLDTAGFVLGLPHSHGITGHRGFSHSLLAAGVIGMVVGFVFFRRVCRHWWAYGLFFSVITASHGLLDTITNGGGGVALLWPFNEKRFFASRRPLAVSPIGVRHFLTSPRAWTVLTSEFLYVWVPAIWVMFLSFLCRQFLGRPAADKVVDTAPCPVHADRGS